MINDGPPNSFAGKTLHKLAPSENCVTISVALPQPGGTRTLIGTLGAFSKDDPPGTCEIGYSILPSFEGQGFATEGTLALIDYLRRNTSTNSIIAHTFPSLPRSIRVMEKCGLVLDGDGEEAGTIRYRLNLRS